jgi:high-affinity Fe2+/Pb2+ permease
MRQNTSTKWLTVQWLAVSALFAILFYQVVSDLATGSHDSLFVLWIVLAAVTFAASVLSGFAIWRSRSGSR